MADLDDILNLPKLKPPAISSYKRTNYIFLENNKYLYYEKSKKDKSGYEKYFDETHDVIKDLSIGDVSYTILINKNL